MQVKYSADGTVLLECTDAQGTLRVQEGCKEIAARACMYEGGITNVELPDTIERIGDFAFACTGLAAFEAPANLEHIGEKAFFKCASLERVRLNEGLRELGEHAFSSTMIGEIDLPASLESMGRIIALDSPMWWSRTCLMRIESENERYFLDEAGGIYQRDSAGPTLVGVALGSLAQHDVLDGTFAIADDAYRGLKLLKSVKLPEGLREIGNQAFRGCGSLTSVSLPKTLEEIGERAFYDTSLHSLVLPASLHHIGDEALLTGKAEKRTLKHLDVDEGNERFYIENGILCEREAAPDGGDLARGFFGNGKEIVVPNSVTAFSSHAFARCESIDELRVGTQVNYVPPSALITRTFISHFIFDLDEPLCGSSQLDLLFVPSRGSRIMMGIALNEHGLDIQVLTRLSDQAAITIRDVFERSSWLLTRLSLPQLLDEETRKNFMKRLERDLIVTCELFAQRGYLQGFERLEEHGLLRRDNIQEAVEAVVAVGDAASIAHMLDIRKRLGTVREAMTI